MLNIFSQNYLDETKGSIKHNCFFLKKKRLLYLRALVHLQDIGGGLKNTLSNTFISQSPSLNIWKYTVYPTHIYKYENIKEKKKGLRNVGKNKGYITHERKTGQRATDALHKRQLYAMNESMSQDGEDERGLLTSFSSYY